MIIKIEFWTLTMNVKCGFNLEREVIKSDSTEKIIKLGNIRI